MPRRRVVAKREILPDPLYGSQVLTRFVNCIMLDGKKSVAETIVYGALDIIDKKIQPANGPLEVFERALHNVKPAVEVKSRRVGGATYQVPIEVRPDRARALAMRWIVEHARKRSEQGMMHKLAGELLDAADSEEDKDGKGGKGGKGGAVGKRNDVHRMAEANKAFSHFRF